MGTDLHADMKCKLQLNALAPVSSDLPSRIDEIIKKGNLPTIAEDTVENDTIDFGLLGKKKAAKPPASRLQHKRNLVKAPVQS